MTVTDGTARPVGRLPVTRSGRSTADIVADLRWMASSGDTEPGAVSEAADRLVELSHVVKRLAAVICELKATP